MLLAGPACREDNPAFGIRGRADAAPDVPADVVLGDAPPATPDLRGADGAVDLLRPDGPVDVLPPDASVPDAAPACLAADPADEDGDGVRDACDNCPADPNPQQENVRETAAGRPADPLGDACDPRSDQPGDALLFFDGFAAAALDPAWVGDRASFTVRDGSLEYGGNNDSNDHLLRRGDATDVAVTAAFTITAFSTASERRNLFLGVRGDPANVDANHLYHCSARRDSDGSGSLAFFDWANTATPAATRPTPVEVGPLYRLTMRAHAAQLDCTLSTATFDRSDARVRSGYVALRARLLSARVRYVVAYRLGP